MKQMSLFNGMETVVVNCLIVVEFWHDLNAII